MQITRRGVLLGTGALALTGAGVVTVPMLLRPGEMAPTTSRAAPVEGLSQIPAEADVVIIGAGIMGVSTAYFLALKGMSVVICEKGVVAGEQSSRAYGQATNWGQDPRIAALGQHSKALWAGMNERIGADTSYRAYGRVQGFDNDEDIEAAREWLEAAQNHADLKARWVEGAELAALLPGAQSSWKMGLYQEDDGGMEPAFAASAVARAAQALGVQIVTGCAVRSLERAGGAVAGVVTEKGPIRTKRVLLAGGSWSRSFLTNLGVNLPVLPVYLQQQRLSAVAGPPACGAVGRVVWRQEVDGSYSNGPRFMTSPLTREHFALLGDFAPELPALLLSETPLDFTIGADLINSFRFPRHWRPDQVSPYESRRVMAPTLNEKTLDESLGWIREEFPAFRESQVIERWAGTVDVTADEVPVASAVARIPGLFVTAGFTFGLTQGLGTGDLMADLIAGDPPKIPADLLKLERVA